MFARKIVISFWLLVISLFITPFTAFAQGSTPSSTSKESKPTFEVSQALPTTVSPTSPLYTDLLIHNIFHSLSCLGTGQSIIGQPCLTYKITKNAQGAIQGIPVLASANLSGGLLGSVTGVIEGLYRYPSVRSSEYLATVGQDLGIIKEAQAQGVEGSGANVLRPIVSLWQASRNIAYLVMIVIFVVIGLMVIFRQRINPQTVITAQAAIPGLIIGLILITFSYFLAGLISDTAFLGTNMVGSYFSAVKGRPEEPQNLSSDLTATSMLKIFGGFVGLADRGAIRNVTRTVYNSIGEDAKYWIRLFAGVMAFQTGASIGGPVGSLLGAGICASGVVSAPFLPFCTIIGQFTGQGLLGGGFAQYAYSDPGGAFAWPIFFIVLAALIYTMIMLLLRLINSYLTIIFLTVTAPFHFLFASLPGRQSISTDWILSMLGNVLVFPAVLAVFYFVAFILGQDIGPLTISSLNQNNLAPTVYAQEKVSIVGKSTFPLFGGLDLEFLKFIVAFGALLATPAIPDIVTRTVGKASQAGQLIGQEISGSTRAGQRYGAQLTSAPGQLGRGLSPARELGSTYQTYASGTGFVTVRTPGLVGRLFGQGPTALPTKKP